MPDPAVIDPSPAAVAAPEESTEALFNRLVPSSDQQQQQAQPEPAKPEPHLGREDKSKPAEVPQSGQIDIPAELLSGKKAEPEPDEYEKVISEEPQGQLKHEHYKRVQAAAKKKVETVTAELAAARTELEAARKRGVPDEIAAELKNVRDALAEREAVLERIAVQESPKFKERYTAKETAIAERLKRTATEFGLDAEAIQQAMTSGYKRRAEILDGIDLGPTARGAIDGLLSQYDLLQDDKASFLAQSRDVHAKWQKEQQEAMTRQEQERSAHETKVFDAALEAASKSFMPYQEVEGNEVWNAQARALKEEARKYFNGQVELDKLAEAVIKGVGAPVQDKIIARQQKAITDLQAEIAALKTAQPGSNGHLPSPDGKADLSKMSADERAMFTFNQAVGNAANNGFGQ